MIIVRGPGNRTGQDIPKQFIHVDNCPVIIHTILAFQRHPDITAVAVACPDGWETVLSSYAHRYDVPKLRWIFVGGVNGQGSISNGICGLKKNGIKEDDLVLVHDAVRPLVSQSIISSNIAVCRQYSYVITGTQCREAVLESNDGSCSVTGTPRDKLIRTQIPQTFRLENIINVHKQAKSKGIIGSVSSCILLAELGGYETYMAPGEEQNIKIVTTEDLKIFKVLRQTSKGDWLKWWLIITISEKCGICICRGKF